MAVGTWLKGRSCFLSLLLLFSFCTKPERERERERKREKRREKENERENGSIVDVCRLGVTPFLFGRIWNVVKLIGTVTSPICPTASPFLPLPASLYILISARIRIDSYSNCKSQPFRSVSPPHGSSVSSRSSGALPIQLDRIPFNWCFIYSSRRASVSGRRKRRIVALLADEIRRHANFSSGFSRHVPRP